MNRFGITLVIFVLLVVVSVWLLYFRSAGVRTKPCVDSLAPTALSDKIRITSPKPCGLVTSPLTVTGAARGQWFFEASFPVRLLDSNGKVLSALPAQADGEWMTPNFVPFHAVLTFALPATATGTLLLIQDNPSGLPANDASYSIPVRFR